VVDLEDDKEDYDGFVSDDDEETMNKGLTGAVPDVDTKYQGPFQVKLNVAKLERNKKRLAGLNNRTWKDGWMYFYPEHRTILIVFNAEAQKRLEFNAVDSSSPTVLREANIYIKKKHVAYLENVNVHESNASVSRDLVVSFASEQKRTNFIEIITDYVLTMRIRETTDNEVVMGTDMTIMEKKLVKANLRDRVYKRILLFKKLNKDDRKREHIDEKFLNMVVEEDDQSDSESLIDKDEATEIPFCQNCCIPYEGSVCPTCKE